MRTIKSKELQLYVNDYMGEFKYLTNSNKWKKLYTIGNSGIAMNFAYLLRRLGYKIKITEQYPNE